MRSRIPAGPVWRAGVLFLLGVVLAGCNTTRTVHRAGGFDAAALQEGGVAVVAIVRARERDYQAASSIAGQVREQFQKRWPMLNIISVNEVRKILAPAVHDKVYQAFYETGTLSATELDQLKPLREKVRYALLVDVWEDKVWMTSAWESVPVTSYVTDPDTGQSSWQTTFESQLIDQTNRSLKTAFTVYDLDTGQPAWIVEQKLSRTHDWLSLGSRPSASGLMSQLTKDTLRTLSKSPSE